MESDKQILQKHLNELYITSKDGDKVVHALRRVIDLLDDTIWINTEIDFMIAVNNGNLDVYQKGNRLEKIEELKFNYNKTETPIIEIKQFI